MLYGFSVSNLQATFEADSLEQARHLTDQFNILGPIFLALTPSMPFFRGKLADVDSGFVMTSDALDDRTEDEMDPTSPKYIPTSRYDLTNVYIGTSPANLPEYTDFDFRIRL